MFGGDIDRGQLYQHVNEEQVGTNRCDSYSEQYFLWAI